MSHCPVLLTRITKVRDHPDPETVNLQVAEILGWQVCIHRDNRYQEGDLLAYVPPDALVPLWVSEAVEVTAHLSKQRTRCIRLRGEPSFGFTIPLRFCPASAQEGDDLAEYFGIVKWLPPFRGQAGDGICKYEADNALAPHYTNVNNLRDYRRVFEPGERVVVTEKIHGSNVRLAIIEGEQYAGSHRVLRKRPDDITQSPYWFPWSKPSIEQMLTFISHRHKQVILYGEVYGPIQKLTYGSPRELQFRAFDLMIDGKYLGFEAFRANCEMWGVQMVPLLYDGPFAMATIVALAQGRTEIPTASVIIDDVKAMKEGVVVRSYEERRDPKVGRCVLKYVSDQYLTGKFNDDAADDRALVEMHTDGYFDPATIAFA